MFGYVVPQKSELRVRELNVYNAFYCGLCKQIGADYGQAARVLLNYDCTFLALLICAVNEPAKTHGVRCVYKPYKGKMAMVETNTAMRFAADVNVLLAYYKLLDDRCDEKKLRGYVGTAAFSAAAKQAKRRNQGLAEAISGSIARLSELEKNRCVQIDEAANVSACMMRDIAALAPMKNENERVALLQLAYSLGRWIYLADAWDDREKDKKSGSYNPFNVAGIDDADRAGFLLTTAARDAADAYELLTLCENKPILDNIIFDGLYIQTKKLLKIEASNGCSTNTSASAEEVDGESVSAKRKEKSQA